MAQTLQLQIISMLKWRLRLAQNSPLSLIASYFSYFPSSPSIISDCASRCFDAQTAQAHTPATNSKEWMSVKGQSENSYIMHPLLRVGGLLGAMEREKTSPNKWKVDGRETITQPGYLRLSRRLRLE